MDKEVHSSASAGAGFILQMEGNLWPGTNIVKGDINVQNKMVSFLKIFSQEIST